MFLAERDGALAGFYSLILQDEPELDLMFVADTAQATGIGTLLIGHLRDEARRLGISTIQIVSHPPIGRHPCAAQASGTILSCRTRSH